MRIGINLLPYLVGKNGGIEVYVRNLCRALSHFQCDHEFVLFVRSPGCYLPDDPRFSEIVMPQNFDRNRATRVVFEQLFLPGLLRKHQIDCLYSNYVIPLLSRVKQVVNVHDLLYKRYPELVEPVKRFYWNAGVPLSLRRSSAVMTVSGSSASDIRHIFPVVREKLIVTQESVSADLLQCEDTRPEFARRELDLEAPYVLSSATFAPHKNMRNLIRAFQVVSRAVPDVQLVLTGRANTPDAAREFSEVKNLVRELGISECVRFTGFVSDKLLASLYRGAAVFVNPSLFEGFGLPILEAQHFGAPVVCSDIPVLREVGGRGVVAVDTTSAEGLAAPIVELLSDPERCERLRALGHENVTRYSWNQAAADFVRVCEQAVNGSAQTSKAQLAGCQTS